MFQPRFCSYLFPCVFAYTMRYGFLHRYDFPTMCSGLCDNSHSIFLCSQFSSRRPVCFTKKNERQLTDHDEFSLPKYCFSESESPKFSESMYKKKSLRHFDTVFLFLHFHILFESNVRSGKWENQCNLLWSSADPNLPVICPALRLSPFSSFVYDTQLRTKYHMYEFSFQYFRSTPTKLLLLFNF